jgi:hypothetical protein
VTEHFANRSGEFIAATENPADGVTINVVLTNVPGTDIVRRSLRGHAGLGSLDLAAAFRGAPSFAVRSLPGRRDG